MAIDPNIKNVIVFNNGNVAVCDQLGKQLPQYQGSIPLDPGLLDRVRAACGPDVEWLISEGGEAWTAGKGAES